MYSSYKLGIIFYDKLLLLTIFAAAILLMIVAGAYSIKSSNAQDAGRKQGKGEESLSSKIAYF